MGDRAFCVVGWRPSLHWFIPLDILRCDILRLSPLLGSRIRPLLCETRLLLRLYRSRRDESGHLLPARQILLLHPTCHLWNRRSLSHTSQLPIDRCCVRTARARNSFHPLRSQRCSCQRIGYHDRRVLVVHTQRWADECMEVVLPTCSDAHHPDCHRIDIFHSQTVWCNCRRRRQVEAPRLGGSVFVNCFHIIILPMLELIFHVSPLRTLGAIVLLILGLTLGAAFGWKTAKFLVPFLVSFGLFAFFFIWEARLPDEYALLPAKTWRIPNFAALIIFALYIYGWCVSSRPLPHGHQN